MKRPVAITLAALGLPAMSALAIWLATSNVPRDSLPATPPPLSRPDTGHVRHSGHSGQTWPSAPPNTGPTADEPPKLTGLDHASNEGLARTPAGARSDSTSVAVDREPPKEPPAADASSPEGSADASLYRSWLDQQVVECVRAQQERLLDEAARRVWRDLLVDGFRADPDDPAAPDALFEAATLSSWLHEPRAEEELLRECVRHPRVEPTTRILALKRLTSYAIGRDVGEAFAHLNETANAVRALRPGLREEWQHEIDGMLWQKGELLAAYQGMGKAIGWLPAEDAGKRASDYYQAYLDLPPTQRAHPMLPGEASILQALARTLAREGRGQRAAELYRELMRRPDRANPVTLLAAWAAEAEFPQGGDKYRAALEAAERSLPADEWSRSLSYRIARSYLEDGFGAPFLDRVEPLLRSDDLADRAFVNRDGGFRADALLRLAEACQRPDVDDTERAISYYEELLSASPESGVKFLVYLDLARLYMHPLGDRERAVEYYERFLIESPAHPRALGVAEALRQLCEIPTGDDQPTDE